MPPGEPVLVTLGRLERLLMAQADVADAWALQKPDTPPAAEAGAKEDAETAGGTAAATDGPTAMATDAPAAAAGGAAVAAAAEPAAEAGAAAVAVAGDPEDLAAADADGAGGALANGGMGAPAAAAAGGSAAARSRRTPEELSHDVLHHSLLAIRSFYIAVAKAIHTSSRCNGREDPAAAPPSLGMRSATLCLALNITSRATWTVSCRLCHRWVRGQLPGRLWRRWRRAAEDVMAVDDGAAAAPLAVPPKRRAVHLQR